MSPARVPRRNAGGPVGVLRLDTGFRRYPRDIGGTEGLPFPVIHENLPSVTARVATEGTRDVLPDLVAAAERLVARGAGVITTSCGFLVLYQETLGARLPVPLVSSSLLQVPVLARIHPAGRIGVLTFNGATFGAAHLRAAGADPDTPFAGLPHDGVFRADILGGPPASTEQRLDEARRTMRDLLAKAPDIVAVVCECTNLAPYAAELSRAFELPVYDLVNHLEWLRSGDAGVVAAPDGSRAHPSARQP